ncbi:hypothetical protein EOE48_11895 [Methylobacterium oryzihabitans]|uniref:Magnesium transporter MgtE intracellular domain-containing protein n=1 Tax=Methylobacterium oryzihabitans TaxID=2499852 RepID=A0A437P7Y0_9HYPH|nr:hypothetical protein EOE48_11895 [Methylobacterium oryzihabitans]
MDAVALAAGGLLVLKLGGLAVEDPGGQPDFARVLAHARSGYPDPVVTGSTAPKEPAAGAIRQGPQETPPPAAPDVSLTERALLEKLGARRDALQQRSRDLEAREQLIGTVERRIEGQIGDLRKLETQEAEAARPSEAEAAALRNIVTMYETMKPKEAARVFDRLSLDVLVPVVLGMNPRKMAEVLAVMQPEAAERLTVALAQRTRKTPPKAPAASASALPPTELPAIGPSGR